MFLYLMQVYGTDMRLQYEPMSFWPKLYLVTSHIFSVEYSFMYIFSLNFMHVHT